MSLGSTPWANRFAFLQKQGDSETSCAPCQALLAYSPCRWRIGPINTRPTFPLANPSRTGAGAVLLRNSVAQARSIEDPPSLYTLRVSEASLSEQIRLAGTG